MNNVKNQQIIIPQKCLYSPVSFNTSAYSNAIKIVSGNTKIFPHAYFDAILKTRMINSNKPKIIPEPKNNA